MHAEKAIDILKHLIELSSFSKQEHRVADYLCQQITDIGYTWERYDNNVIVKGQQWDENKPVLLLNSHLDTVKPSDKWTMDPFKAYVENGKLYGLGSNDAGGCLVSLLATFVLLDQKEQPYNLLFVASAEEEISGPKGMSSIRNRLPQIAFAVVGEPTLMNLAIAEKGLMVLDCVAQGKAGHAARNEGVNSIYEALPDLEWFRTYRFPKKSKVLGDVKMSVTQINAGSQHNVVPDHCSFVVDVRSNENYSNQDLYNIIKSNVTCDVTPRSFRLNSSCTPHGHEILLRAERLGRKMYGSPTTSDQAVLNCPSVKLGPGDSARSHTANEYIGLDEIENGIKLYVELLDWLTIC